MSALPSIAYADVAGRTVLLRADLDAPLWPDTPDLRAHLKRTVLTIRELIAHGAGVVVIGHLGHPGGEPNPVYSLAPIAGELAAALHQPVRFAPDCIGAAAEAVTRGLAPGDVVLLENLRFHRGEEANDRSLAMMLSVHGDLYVNDLDSAEPCAFASTDAIASLMPAFSGPAHAARPAPLPQPVSENM